MSDHLLSSLLFEPASLQVYQRVPGAANGAGGQRRLMTLGGEWQTVPAPELCPLEPAQAGAALASLNRDSGWMQGLLGGAVSPEIARLLGATSTEEFLAALMALSHSERLPELEKQLATLEHNAAVAARLLGEGFAPAPATATEATFAPPEGHPARVALLALARVAASNWSNTTSVEPEAPVPQSVSIKLSPPRLDFSPERMAVVRAEGQVSGKRKPTANRGRK